jgi:integrase
VSETPKALRIHIRDERLTGGRMDISAQTADPEERDARLASVMQLLKTERGRAIVDRLRARKVTIEAVHRAVQSLDLASVEPKPEEAEPEAPKALPVMLGETVDAWLRYLEGADRSPETLETYRVIIRSMEAEFGVKREAGGRIVQDMEVGAIPRSAAEAWLTGPKETTGGKPWAPSSQRTAHAVVSQLWDRAISEDEDRVERHGTERTVTRNFWRKQGSRKGVKGARIRKTRVEFLRRLEAARLLRSIKGSPYAAWVAIGVYAGLRPGEIANLRRVIDVDMEAGVIHVQDRGGEFAWRVKNPERGQRRVPIHPRLARWLRQHMRLAGDLYLFTPEGQDRPLGRSEWRKWIMAAYKAGGIRYGRKKDALTAHSLRHTFGSWLTITDVHPKKIAALMGDTVKEVMDTYSHLIDEDLEEAIRRL